MSLSAELTEQSQNAHCAFCDCSVCSADSISSQSFLKFSRSVLTPHLEKITLCRLNFKLIVFYSRFPLSRTGEKNGSKRTRGQYLIPHNPQNSSEIDFTFDKTTKDYSFRDIYRNTMIICKFR